MKRRYIFLLLVLVCAFGSNGCVNGASQADPWLGGDKLKHAAISAGIAAGSTLFAKEAEVSASSAPIIGFSASFAVGIGKETYDQQIRKTFWSWKDLCWDALGSTVGSLAASR